MFHFSHGRKRCTISVKPRSKVTNRIRAAKLQARPGSLLRHTESSSWISPKTRRCTSSTSADLTRGEPSTWMAGSIRRISSPAITVIPSENGMETLSSSTLSDLMNDSGSIVKANRTLKNFTLLNGSHDRTSTPFDTKSQWTIPALTRRRGRVASCFDGAQTRNCSSTCARTTTNHRKAWSGRRNPWTGQARSFPSRESATKRHKNHKKHHCDFCAFL